MYQNIVADQMTVVSSSSAMCLARLQEWVERRARATNFPRSQSDQTPVCRTLQNLQDLNDLLFVLVSDATAHLCRYCGVCALTGQGNLLYIRAEMLMFWQWL